jgi:hypothetical protein
MDDKPDGRKRRQRTAEAVAMLNMVFAIASVLISWFGGNASDRVAVYAWVSCAALFGISYCILLFQVLVPSPDRTAKLPLWVSAWTAGIGLLAAMGVLGFLHFMAVF